MATQCFPERNVYYIFSHSGRIGYILRSQNTWPSTGLAVAFQTLEGALTLNKAVFLKNPVMVFLIFSEYEFILKDLYNSVLVF